jgi:hypothetical protein
MRLIVKDVLTSSNRSEPVLLITDTWDSIEKTFNVFTALANYELTFHLEFRLVDGVAQIDGITTSVTGGANL